MDRTAIANRDRFPATVPNIGAAPEITTAVLGAYITRWTLLLLPRTAPLLPPAKLDRTRKLPGMPVVLEKLVAPLRFNVPVSLIETRPLTLSCALLPKVTLWKQWPLSTAGVRRIIMPGDAGISAVNVKKC